MEISGGKIPPGKLPVDLLNRLLAQAPTQDPRVLLGPGIGIDCAIVKTGDTLQVFKSDPITFATDQIGWYVVQVNANDIVTTGAVPRWMLITMLLPEQGTTVGYVEQIAAQVSKACRDIGITLIGGHSEVTAGLDRPVLVGTLVGEVKQEDLVTPRGARPGDRLLLTKGIPIEATAILAREFPEELAAGGFSPEEIHKAQEFLTDPGISIVKDVKVALQAGKITAMHDPTEGGLATAIWEISEACGRSIYFDPATIYIPDLSARICRVFDLDPLGAIASGALLFTAPPGDGLKIRQALEQRGILCMEIGAVEDGPVSVWVASGNGRELLLRPQRDEIARLFER